MHRLIHRRARAQTTAPDAVEPEANRVSPNALHLPQGQSPHRDLTLRAAAKADIAGAVIVLIGAQQQCARPQSDVAAQKDVAIGKDAQTAIVCAEDTALLSLITPPRSSTSPLSSTMPPPLPVLNDRSRDVGR